LGFARFKLRNGWENNTLFDVEYLWKERQRRMVDALPMPRFTQRDILDQWSRQREMKTKKQRIKLTRSLSANTTTAPYPSRSSLDDLSYAIALTEHRSRSETPPMITAPSSPVQAAAEAMMLFGHHSQ
jgi:hypothetical protein